MRMHGLETDVARLALRVVRARLDRDRDGLLVFFVCIILFCVAAAVYLLTHLLVAAAPVVVLARRVTVPQLTAQSDPSLAEAVDALKKGKNVRFPGLLDERIEECGPNRNCYEAVKRERNASRPPLEEFLSRLLGQK